MTETILCPTCNVEPTDIDGKLVCTECYKVVDRPSGSLRQSTPAPAPAPAPGAAPAAAAQPGQPAAAAPAPVPTGPSQCPTCNVETTNVDGKMVCTKCYRVIDAPQMQIAQGSPPSNYQQSIQTFAAAVVVLFLVVLYALVQWMSHNTPH